MAEYPHMCRDGHVGIGHALDDECCPLCLVLEALADLSSAALAASDWTDRNCQTASGAAYLRACVLAARSAASEVQR